MRLLRRHVKGGTQATAFPTVISFLCSYLFHFEPGVPWSVTKTFLLLSIFPVYTSDMHSCQRGDSLHALLDSTHNPVYSLLRLAIAISTPRLAESFGARPRHGLRVLLMFSAAVHIWIWASCTLCVYSDSAGVEHWNSKV